MEAAAAMGIDMPLIEYNLSRTPGQRLRFHDGKVKGLVMIEERERTKRGSSHC